MLDEIRNLYNQQQRINVAYPNTKREVIGPLIRYTMESVGKSGWVLWSALDEQTADAAIAQEKAHFEAIGYELEWKHYDYDKPADLGQRLLAAGFTREPAEAIMVLDLDANPAILSQTVPEGLRRIKTPDGVDDIMVMLGAVWNEDFTQHGEFLKQQLADAPESVSVYGVYTDDHLVSGGWMMVTPDCDFASLWGGSTLEDYRKRGIYTGLLAARSDEAKSRGIRFLTVDASPMSRPILERFGFVCIATATAYRFNEQKHG